MVDLDDPLHPRHVATLPLTDARASALQFRYLWVTDAEGLKLFDVTDIDAARRRCPRRRCRFDNARRIYLARTYAYVAAKQQGLAIVNVTNPERPRARRSFVTFDGRMNDVEDVIVASTNASLFAYVADGRNGMKVLQLTSFEPTPTLLRLLAAAGARADRLGAHAVAPRSRSPRASTATAPSTRPAARSPSSAAWARARSTAARWSACSSTAAASPTGSATAARWRIGWRPASGALRRITPSADLSASSCGSLRSNDGSRPYARPLLVEHPDQGWRLG